MQYQDITPSPSSMMQYQVIYIGVFFAFSIVVIASAINMLAWLTPKERKKESQKIDVLATCRSGTLAMLFSKVNGPVAHGSTQ